jgi:hypothetical protein
MSDFKVGVLMEGWLTSPLLRELLESLSTQEGVKLYFINNHRPAAGSFSKLVKKTKQVGVARIVSLLTFKLLTKLEKRLLKLKDISVKLSVDLFVKEINVYPVFSKSGLVARYVDKDIEAIQEEQFDILLRGSAGFIFQGKILEISKFGILSFHHGDNTWNRGGPAGFWEVFYKKPATGFVIQVLTSSLDGGQVLFKGELMTRRTFSENQHYLYAESNSFMLQVIKQIQATNSLPEPYESKPFSYCLFKCPSFAVSSLYAIRLLYWGVKLIWERKVLKRNHRWSVGFIHQPWQKANLSKAKIIQNPAGHFFADPFAVVQDGRKVIFVEDYSYQEKKGSISCVVVDENSQYQVISNVISESFHLSFPFVFRYEGSLYLIPESSEAKSIRLYKCVKFPDQWAYQHDLINGIDAVDSMLVPFSGKWWLLTNCTNVSDKGCYSQLRVFYADNPLLTDWVECADNPVCFSSLFGRNAGILSHANKLYRVRQRHGFHHYGKGFSIAQIKELTVTSYKEELFSEVGPNFKKGVIGTHHMHSDGDFTVFDYSENKRAI